MGGIDLEEISLRGYSFCLLTTFSWRPPVYYAHSGSPSAVGSSSPNLNPYIQQQMAKKVQISPDFY